MRVFNDESIRMCATALSSARVPLEALAAWSWPYGKFPELVGIVSLEEYKNALPESIRKYSSPPYNCLVPYFESTSIYFLDDTVFEDVVFRKKQNNFFYDYSMVFDSNVASYINKVIRGQPLGSVQERLVSLLDGLLHDNLNFDAYFYMVENSKNILPLINRKMSKMEFWSALNRKFKENMISFQLFRTIDCAEYRRTSNPRPSISFSKATRRAAEYSYLFYQSKSGRENILRLLLRQRLLLLQLIGVLKIHFSSNRGAKAKIAEYFAYMNDVVGLYFDRESVVAHKFFLDRRKVPILNKFHKRMSKEGLLRKLDNVAWDYMIPRIMEDMIVFMPNSSKAKFFIPFLVTFDEGVKGMMSTVPTKGVIYNNDDGDFFPFTNPMTSEYFEAHGCGKSLEKLNEDTTARLKRPMHDFLSIKREIKRQYGLLLKVV